MKLSKLPTGYILIPARTGSVWDNVNFVIVELPDNYIEAIRKRGQAAKPLQDIDQDFNSVSFWDYNPQWFVADDYFAPETEELEANDDWSFIEVTDKEMERLPKPEQDIDSMQMHFLSDKFYYNGYGKHTNEEFWTSHVDITDFLKAIEQPSPIEADSK
jgi:hypothetical protein